jgi:uroporphyrinogen-III decarboxylase
MNHRERILKAASGKSVDRIPYIPRLDIWYFSNKYNNSLPDKYKNATLKEIVEDLDLGYHYIIPDYKNYDGDDGDVDVGLGLYKFNTRPYTLEFQNIERKIERAPNGTVRTEYITPKGNLTTCFKFDEDMRKMGLTLSVILEHAMKSTDDAEVVAYLFENVKVKPKYDKYVEFKENIVGDNGICAGYSLAWASPMHYISKDLMPFDRFFYEMADNPEKILELAERLTPFFRKVFDIVADSPAQVILSGANYDVSISPPPFFKDHIVPELKRQSDILHKKGKYLITHTDGENKGLLEHFVSAGFDIADSICPYPMTSLTLKEVRDVIGDKITIWGGIPSVSLLENTMSDLEFERYIDDLLSSIGSGRRMIFAIADTTPPAAKFDRILTLYKRIREFGPVK